MDWKKETLSAAELERRQQEYRNAALTMMKRSSEVTGHSSGGSKGAPTDAAPAASVQVVSDAGASETGWSEAQLRTGAPEPTSPDLAEASPADEERQAPELTAAVVTAQQEEKTTVSAAVVEAQPAPAAEPEKEPEPEAEQKAMPKEEKKEKTSAAAEKEPKPDPPEKPDTNFGVYTADELLSGKQEGEGLRKAAEILEEMSRNTEMMKKLAEEGQGFEPGTTDFPDFASVLNEGENEKGEFFRKDGQDGEGQQECEECTVTADGKPDE